MERDDSEVEALEAQRMARVMASRGRKMPMTKEDIDKKKKEMEERLKSGKKDDPKASKKEAVAYRPTASIVQPTMPNYNALSTTSGSVVDTLESETKKKQDVNVESRAPEPAKAPEAAKPLEKPDTSPLERPSDNFGNGDDDEEAREAQRMNRHFGDVLARGTSAPKLDKANIIEDSNVTVGSGGDDAKRREEERMAKMGLGFAPTPKKKPTNTQLILEAEKAPAKKAEPKLEAKPEAKPEVKEVAKPAQALSELPDGSGWMIECGKVDCKKSDIKLIKKGKELKLVYPPEGSDVKMVETVWGLPFEFDSTFIKPHFNEENRHLRIKLGKQTDLTLPPGETEGVIAEYHIPAGSTKENVELKITTTDSGFIIESQSSKYDEDTTVTLSSPSGEKPIINFAFKHVEKSQQEGLVIKKTITTKQDIRTPYPVTTGSFSVDNEGRRLTITKPSKPSSRESGNGDAEFLIPME